MYGGGGGGGGGVMVDVVDKFNFITHSTMYVITYPWVWFHKIPQPSITKIDRLIYKLFNYLYKIRFKFPRGQ